MERETEEDVYVRDTWRFSCLAFLAISDHGRRVLKLHASFNQDHLVAQTKKPMDIDVLKLVREG